MASEIEEPIGSETEQSSNELKKKVADHAADASVQAQEDPSRSSLHYGSDHEPDTAIQSDEAGQRDFAIPDSDSRAQTNSSADPVSGIGGETAASLPTGSEGIGDAEFENDPMSAETSDGQDTTSPTTTSTHESPNSISNGETIKFSKPLDSDVPVSTSFTETETTMDQVDAVESKSTNEGPDAVSLSGSNIAENAQGAVIGRLEVSDVDAGDSHSFTLSDDRFEVVDGTVKLKDGVALDHEEAAQVSLEVTATDSAGAQHTQSFEINVADLNEGPDAVSLSGSNVAENAQGAVIGRLEVSDVDAGDSHSFTLSDDRFEVVDGTVKLKDGVALDHEEAAQVSLEVTATDSAGAQHTQSFEINVADLNEGPDAVSLSGSNVAENAQGAVIGRLEVSDVDAGDSHSFTLSDDRFEVVDGTVKLKDGVALDHEEAAQVSLEVTATDSAGAQHTQSFEINVADLNEGPDAVSLSGSNVAENAQGAVIGRLEVSDVDAGDSHSFTLSDDRFEVVDGTVKLKDGVALDHEEAAQVSLEVTATDSAGAQHTQSFEINVADLNEGPDAVSLSGSNVAENAQGAVIGRLEVSDVDAGDSHSFTLSDDRFEVVDGTVKLKDGVALDHEEAAQVSLEVTATDSAGAQHTQSFEINVADLNEGPDAVSLSGSNVAENAQGAVIGRLEVSDVDAGDSHSFTLSDDRFEVVDGTVKLKDGVALDHEEAAQVSLEVTATDSAGAQHTQSFEINVADLNEGPDAVSLSGSNVAENAQGAVIGRLEVSDVDAGDSHSFTLSDDRFEVVDGTVKLKDGVALDHEEAAQVSLEVTATDSAGAQHTQSFEINVADLNEGPDAVSLSGSNVAENAQGAVIGRLEVSDVDAGDSHSFTLSDDRFEVVDGTVKLKDGVALDHEEAAQVSLDVTATDSAGAQHTQSFEINVADLNEGPDAVSLSGSNVAENAQGAVIGRLEVSDVDAGDSHSFTLSDDRFEVVDGTVKLKDGVALDHEEAAQVSLDVTATDSAGAQHTQSFEINVADLNEGPDAVSLSGSNVAENAQGAVIGRLEVSDVDAGDSHSFTLSDDRFEVVDGTVKLKDGVALDHEEAAQVSLDVTATDSAGAQHTQSFEINVADLNEGPDAVSLSGSNVAENAQGAVIGRLEVSDVDAGDSHSFTLSDDRFEVVDGTVKLKDGVALDHEEAAQVSLDVTATDSAGAQHTQSFEINVAEMPDATVGSGFHARYFDVDHSLRSLDQIDWDGAPTHEELVGDINYTNSSNSFWEGGSRDTFGAKITGNIDVEEGGTFNFHVGGDDGVVLIIDGVEVVDNDGLHGFRTRSGEIELEPGTHVIEVRYFENYGHAGLKVEWEGPGVDGREVLTAPDIGDLQTVNGMPLTVELNVEDTSAVDGSIAHILDGLPNGTLVQAGDNIAQVGEDGTVDVTGWDSSMMSITPPIEFIGQVDAKLTTELTLGDGQVVSKSVDMGFVVDEAQLDASHIDVQAGFHASYYDVDHSLRKLDDINWDSDPTHEEVVSEVNYQNGRDSFWDGGSTDTFGAKITGNITVEEGGSYDFFVGGDDGVMLFIDGVEVIDNDGLHGYRTRSGEIELEPGTHEVEVRYFENYGHAGLKLEWDGPDTDGREFVQADSDLSVAENGTLEVHLDTNLSDSVAISGLPADTIIVSGEDSAVSDGSEIDLSGWNLDLVEFMPPAGFVGEIDATLNVTGEAFNGQTVENQHVFTISVGDPDSEEYSSSNSDEMLMVADQDSAASHDGWSDESAKDGTSQDSDDDDAMGEEIEMTQTSDQSYESFETYERQDW